MKKEKMNFEKKNNENMDYEDKEENTEENSKENRIEKIKENSAEKTKENRTEKTKENSAEKTKENRIEKIKENSAEKTKENRIEKTKENRIEKIKENSAEKIKESRIEKTKENRKELKKENDKKISDSQFFMNQEVPEYKVYFTANFCGISDGNGRAGKELALGRHFIWNGEQWQVPSVYLCAKGIVADFLLQVPAERIKAFTEKWRLTEESSYMDFDCIQQMYLEYENPLHGQIHPKLFCNGKEMETGTLCLQSFCPGEPDRQFAKDADVIRHYGLDASYGWTVCRALFPWKTKRRTDIRTLSVLMEQMPSDCPGPRISAAAGAQTVFVHPSTGIAYTLTVCALTRHSFSENEFPASGQESGIEFPRCFTCMTYTVSPDLPENAYYITDEIPSDQPKQKQTDSNGTEQENEDKDEVCRMIIGGADGPTSIFYAASEKMDRLSERTASSSVHFTDSYSVIWRLIYRCKNCPDLKVQLYQK